MPYTTFAIPRPKLSHEILCFGSWPSGHVYMSTHHSHVLYVSVSVYISACGCTVVKRLPASTLTYVLTYLPGSGHTSNLSLFHGKGLPLCLPTSACACACAYPGLAVGHTHIRYSVFRMGPVEAFNHL